jgi:hypothetical protein
MNDQTYNGWANYETWLVGLWLDNDAGSYEYWRDQAEECWREAPSTEEVKKGTWTREEATKFNLADQIQEEIQENSPIMDAGLYTDLLHGALSEVDWHEVAENFMSNIEETIELDNTSQIEEGAEKFDFVITLSEKQADE